jgi:hypothetical protein
MQKPSFGRALLLCILFFSLIGIVHDFFLSDSLLSKPWTFIRLSFSSELKTLQQSNAFNTPSSSDEKQSQELMSGGEETQRDADSKIEGTIPEKVTQHPPAAPRIRVQPKIKKEPVYRKGRIFAQQNRKVPVPLPTSLEGRPETDPN